MSLRSIWLAAKAAIKTTASGVVEWATNSESLPALWDTQDDINKYRTVAVCDDAAALIALGTEEVQLAYGKGTNFYYYSTTNVGGNGLAAVDGGYWIPHLGPADLLFSALGTKTNGDVPIWNSGTGRYVSGAPTVAAVAWGNITSGKPTTLAGYGITDAYPKTGGAITGNTTISGTLGVTGAATFSSTTSHVGAAAFSGAATFSNTAAFSSTVAFAGDIAVNTNKFTINSTNGNTSTLGTLAVSGTATMSGILACGSLGCTGAAAVVGRLDVGGVAVITGQVTMVTMPSYPNNGAAITGGLTVGQLYRNGDVLMIVH